MLEINLDVTLISNTIMVKINAAEYAHFILLMGCPVAIGARHAIAHCKGFAATT